jgi:hypothetical protein
VCNLSLSEILRDINAHELETIHSCVMCVISRSLSTVICGSHCTHTAECLYSFGAFVKLFVSVNVFKKHQRVSHPEHRCSFAHEIFLLVFRFLININLCVFGVCKNIMWVWNNVIRWPREVGTFK